MIVTLSISSRNRSNENGKSTTKRISTTPGTTNTKLSLLLIAFISLTFWYAVTGMIFSGLVQRQKIVFKSSCLAMSTRSFACTTGKRRSNKKGVPSATSLFDRLRSNKQEVILLDGGTGEELFLHGVPDDRTIWSATAVVHSKYHDALKSVHQSFISAGSRAITTNSFGIVPGVGFSDDEIAKYCDTAGFIARKAAASASSLGEENVLVLGSMGPLKACYRPDLVLPHAQGVAHYKVIAKALMPHIDYFLAETLSSFEESSQVVQAVGEQQQQQSGDDKIPIMVSYTLDGKGLIRSGETTMEGMRKLIDFSQQQDVDLAGVLFNCAEPEAITIALQCIERDVELKALLSHHGILLGAYANRLTAVAPDWTMEESEQAQPMRQDVNPSQYCNDFVKHWVQDLGVQLVGGCCGISPEHIAYLHDHLIVPSPKNTH